MKHLDTYKLFENKSEFESQIKYDIIDIFSGLKDDGLKFKELEYAIGSRPPKRDNVQSIIIGIEDSEYNVINKNLNNDIISFIERSIDYLTQYKYTDFGFTIGYNRELEEDGVLNNLKDKLFLESLPKISIYYSIVTKQINFEQLLDFFNREIEYEEITIFASIIN